MFWQVIVVGSLPNPTGALLLSPIPSISHHLSCSPPLVMSGSSDPPSRGAPAAALVCRGLAAGVVVSALPVAGLALAPSLGSPTMVVSPRRVYAVAGAVRMDLRPHLLRADAWCPMYSRAPVAHDAPIQPVLRPSTAPTTVFHHFAVEELPSSLADSNLATLKVLEATCLLIPTVITLTL
jgi:hypothetical protein